MESIMTRVAVVSFSSIKKLVLLNNISNTTYIPPFRNALNAHGKALSQHAI